MQITKHMIPIAKAFLEATQHTLHAFVVYDFKQTNSSMQHWE